MSGYGNKTAEEPGMTHEHEHATRYGKHKDSAPYQGGHDTYGSGATAGVGFGNKSAPDQNMDEYDNSDIRFGKHMDTAPYSGHTEHGSGSTGGAGYGNKTGSFGEPKKDSTMGKLMEKAGGMLHNEGMVEKGKERRASKGYGQVEDEV